MKSKPRSFALPLLLASLLLLLTGCDQLGGALGMETASRKASRLEAEGKAVGGGCRQSGRAIEDCYSIYTWLPKEAVFSGWLDMDAYMRENELETIPPMLPPPPPPPPDPVKKDSAKKKKKAGEDSASDGDTNENMAMPVGPVPAPAPLLTPGASSPGNSALAPDVQETPLQATASTTQP